jgi:hypothetical protein
VFTALNEAEKLPSIWCRRDEKGLEPIVSRAKDHGRSASLWMAEELFRIAATRATGPEEKAHGWQALQPHSAHRHPEKVLSTASEPLSVAEGDEVLLKLADVGAGVDAGRQGAPTIAWGTSGIATATGTAAATPSKGRRHRRRPPAGLRRQGLSHPGASPGPGEGRPGRCFSSLQEASVLANGLKRVSEV